MANHNIFPPSMGEFNDVFRQTAGAEDGLLFGEVGVLIAVAHALRLENDERTITVATSDLVGEFMTGYRARTVGGVVSVGLSREFRNSGSGAVLETPGDLLAIFDSTNFTGLGGRRARPVFDRMAEIVGLLAQQ